MLLCMTGACGDFKTLARFTAAFGDLHDATAVRGRAVSNRTRDHQRPFHGEAQLAPTPRWRATAAISARRRTGLLAAWLAIPRLFWTPNPT